MITFPVAVILKLQGKYKQAEEFASTHKHLDIAWSVSERLAIY